MSVAVFYGAKGDGKNDKTTKKVVFKTDDSDNIVPFVHKYERSSNTFFRTPSFKVRNQMRFKPGIPLNQSTSCMPPGGCAGPGTQDGAAKS
jgi:hypothetical protein